MATDGTDAQALVDEYARRLSIAYGECVALTVALRKSEKENAALYRRIAGLPDQEVGNG